jgi:hypothetical protein
MKKKWMNLQNEFIEKEAVVIACIFNLSCFLSSFFLLTTDAIVEAHE